MKENAEESSECMRVIQPGTNKSHANKRQDTLDLLLTNDMALFTNIEVNKTNISDHNIMEETSAYSLGMEKRKYITGKDGISLRQNSWKEINELIAEIYWNIKDDININMTKFYERIKELVEGSVQS